MDSARQGLCRPDLYPSICRLGQPYLGECEGTRMELRDQLRLPCTHRLALAWARGHPSSGVTAELAQSPETCDASSFLGQEPLITVSLLILSPSWMGFCRLRAGILVGQVGPGCWVPPSRRQADVPRELSFSCCAWERSKSHTGQGHSEVILGAQTGLVSKPDCWGQQLQVATVSLTTGNSRKHGSWPHSTVQW